ncbi:MAG: VWA domain-containing protein [Blastocatellia bacterium]|nr:VWA domain-containing protein [Blastocatellia bacterium]MBK6428711.1 VWA domain-containing protein [Blastocatellia bacterium]
MTGFRTIVFVALAVLVAVPGLAAGTRQQQDDDQTQIEALEVFLPVMVFDKKGEFVPGLQRQNFRVFEDGVEQQITSFDAPTQLPLNIALLIDTSSSVKRKLKFEKEAAAAFVMSILERSVDRALLATFDSVVTLHVDFSRDSGDLTRSIDTIKAGGNTRLYDAIYRVCEEKMAQLPPGTRPVMLVITDGADVGSDRSLDEAIAMAQRTSVTIFGISTRNYSDINAGTTRGSVDKDLEKLCEQTGGRTFLPYQRIELERAFAGVRTLLRNQYVIYYEPKNQVRDGKYRKIEVKTENIDRKADIRAKAGYFAVPAGTDTIPR